MSYFLLNSYCPFPILGPHSKSQLSSYRRNFSCHQFSEKFRFLWLIFFREMVTFRQKVNFPWIEIKRKHIEETENGPKIRITRFPLLYIPNNLCVLLVMISPRLKQAPLISFSAICCNFPSFHWKIIILPVRASDSSGLTRPVPTT